MQATTHMRAKSGRALFLALAGLAALVAITFLALNVQREIRLMGSAQSDNVQWALAQAEVEYLEYMRQLDAPQPNVKDLTRRFDVFFSRIRTLGQASVFEELRATEATKTQLDDIKTFLAESAAIIDAGEETVIARLPELNALAAEARPKVRLLAKSGLSVFAETSDAQRLEVARTLKQLAAALALLISALFVGVLYLNKLNAQVAGRERAQSLIATRMNTVISTSLDAVIVSDSAGKIIEFNPAAETTFGHQAKDVMGQDIGDIIVPEHMRAAHQAGMERMQRSGERRVVGKGRVKLDGKRANGDVFPVELALQSAETEDGEIFIAFLRDISKRVENEQELVRARDKALAGEKLKADFLATMSHEIRTPLNGLLGNLNLLRDTRLSKEQDRYLGYMESSGRLLMSHISDVLDITRYDAGKLQTRQEPVNLSALIEDIIDNQSGTAVENETTLDWGWDGEPMHWIVSDHDRLQHVMMNLIGNAVKFTRRGRVSITARAEPNEEHTLLTLDVADTGVGIEEDLLPQIFDDFVVGDTPRTREAGGTGLGLGIAKRFVEALGGDIHVHSIAGQGSRFTLTLPVLAAEPPTTEEVEAPVSALCPLNILLVEDNEVNRIVARKMIEADGHHVSEAYDGAQGVTLATSQRFDLIFMDINMPVMDGRSATRKIRADAGASATTPIIALTANAMASDQDDLIADGMNAVLTKPLSRIALRHAIVEFGQRDTSPRVPIVDADHCAETRQATGEQAFAKLTARFAQEVEALLEWLASDEAHDYLEVAARCHKTAGSAAVFGAVGLRETLKRIEDAAKTGDSASFTAEVSELPSVWMQTKSQLT